MATGAVEGPPKSLRREFGCYLRGDQLRPRPSKDGSLLGRCDLSDFRDRSFLEALEGLDGADSGAYSHDAAAWALQGAPGTEGRHPADRAVELPGEPFTDGPIGCPCCWQHLLVEAFGDRSCIGAGAEAASASILGPRGDNCRHRGCAGDYSLAEASLGPHPLHRQWHGRTHCLPSSRGVSHALHPRAGWQVAHSGAPGCECVSCGKANPLR
mmetsp:Transcript_12103/g.25571  ORF Transcript_12103/g.25571 Transcript_12103/m.25571 type:complete len:212 (+) Transcript_12103:152-787(+)